MPFAFGPLITAADARPCSAIPLRVLAEHPTRPIARRTFVQCAEAHGARPVDVDVVHGLACSSGVTACPLRARPSQSARHK